MPKGIFKNPQERIDKIRLAKIGVKRPPLSLEWRKKISDSGKLSNAGKYERTPEIKEKARLARLKQTFTPEQKQKQIDALLRASKIYIGEKHHNWKGGITTENAKVRSSRRYVRWRTKVFTRDNYTCMDCGARNGNGVAVYLEVHHIKSFADHPELRFAINNGITLCRLCHKKTETYGKRRKKL